MHYSFLNISNMNENINSSKLGEFFVNSLQEMYWCETHLVEVLSTMTEVSTSAELRDAFETHRDQTRQHVETLDNVFEMLGIKREPRSCAGVQGLFDEGWDMINQTETGSAQRDAALIIAAQKVEHYEIATYGSLVTLAKTLGRKDVAKQLKKTLEEEKETDALLTSIAEASINEEASEEPANVNR
jgi:ferritin-like metal-binding protein YciE